MIKSLFAQRKNIAALMVAMPAKDRARRKIFSETDYSIPKY